METKNIMIVGVGGQGTLLASKILGHVLLSQNFDVKVSEVHGMSQRGGSVVTYVRYGEKVYSPVIDKGEADAIVAFEKLEAMRYAHFLKKDGVLIVNDQEIAPMTVVTGNAVYPDGIIGKLKEKYNVIDIDAMEKARELGNTRCFNVIILGVAARSMDFSKEQWLKVIADTVPQKTIEINQKAFIAGFEG